jgi:hypothetical protein
MAVRTLLSTGTAAVAVLQPGEDSAWRDRLACGSVVPPVHATQILKEAFSRRAVS